MAARLPSSLRALTSQPLSLLRPTFSQRVQRSFHTSQIRQQEGITASRKPVGGFRGTLFGFLLGSFLAGSGLYYYVVEEYKVSNELLTEDIYALQAAVHRLEGYVRSIEEEQKTKK